MTKHTSRFPIVPATDEKALIIERTVESVSMRSFGNWIGEKSTLPP